MATAVIIQARTGSTRLPGKVLEGVAGKPLLYWVVARAQRAILPDAPVLVATPDTDEALRQYCAHQGWAWFGGSEDDVLDRYYQAALELDAETVVRLTADCPLLDPLVVNLVWQEHQRGGRRYTSNVQPATFPDGLDVEVFSFELLAQTWYNTTEGSDREHVTPYMRRLPDIGVVTWPEDLSGHRWTVDTAEDLAFVRQVYEALGPHCGMLDVLEWVREHPHPGQIKPRKEAYDER
jgi:spore coat polysaccharide biosynthesis protein SpsF (cytidylyltransferase family)